jgi:hypothetical protein
MGAAFQGSRVARDCESKFEARPSRAALQCAGRDPRKNAENVAARNRRRKLKD